MSRRAITVIRSLDASDLPPRRRRGRRAAVLALVLTALVLGHASAQTDPDARFAPSSRGGREAVQELAEASFAPEWVGWAVRTAHCESSWNLYAYSAGFDRRWGVFYEHVGALQVDGVTWRRVADGDLLDPAVNFAVAAYVLSVQGTRAWPWCGR